MVDRQDIDALMIGALYGELTPAEEARLNAHLESHPADKSAMADLKSAREAVRESRIFDQQAEPPQAISALLLQEAARRAPRVAAARDDEEKPGWFARLVRSFMLHPAMAAAATLVLVIGVAGTLYLEKGSDQFAEKTVNLPASRTAETAPAPAAGSAALAAAAHDQAAAGSGYEVGLADGDLAKEATAASPSKTRMTEAKNDHEGAEPKPVLRAPAHHASKGAIFVEHSEPRPRDLDRADDNAATSGREGIGAASTGAGVGAGGAAPGGYATSNAAQQAEAPVAPAPSAAPADEPAPAPRQAGPRAAAAPPPPQATAPAMPARRAEPTQWARDQHALAIRLTSSDCSKVASIVLDIEARAPSYYAQYVETDIALKPCLSYINAAHERRTEKARAKAEQVTPSDGK